LHKLTDFTIFHQRCLPYS